MKIHELNESTTAGSVASVAMPMGEVQQRIPKAKSKKVKKPTNEASKAFADKLANKFKKKVEKSNKDKEETDKKVKQHQSEPVKEDEVNEADLILVPGHGNKVKPGFIPKDQDRTDHEVEMARSDLFQAAQNAKKIYAMIKDIDEEQGLEGWVQEKIIKANDYLNTIREYLEHKTYMQEGGVIAGGVSNVEEEKLDEKKDACYSKVKSRYKVWPSAYASGALSKCRKVGASNWGNKSKK